MKCDFALGIDRWSCASVDCINIAPQFSKSVNLHLALSVLLAQ